MRDEPGGGPMIIQHSGPNAGVRNNYNKGYNPLYGEWKYQKGGMDTSTFSNGFGRNQIKRYLRRLFKQEMKKFKENVNYDYHFESDDYRDQH